MSGSYNEQDVLKRLKDGDENALRCLFDIYVRAIKNNIKQFVFDSASVDDIVQEVFIALWLQRCALPDGLKIESWLFAVSYKKSISFLRKKSKFSFAELSIEEINNIANPDEETAAIEKHYNSKLTTLKSGIQNLSPQTKRAFILYKIQNKSYEDISEEMSITVLSAKQYVKMAMKFLKRYAETNHVELSILTYIIVKSTFID